jgi:hypothetical protein
MTSFDVYRGNLIPVLSVGETELGVGIGVASNPEGVAIECLSTAKTWADEWRRS